MEILKQVQRIHVERYYLEFDYRDQPGAGFSFPCTKDGTILQGEMTPTATFNIQMCQSGEYDVVPKGVQNWSYTYTEPAIGKCSCGQEVELLVGFTNTCEGCGLEYNWTGQELAPRSQWEEPWDEDGLYVYGDMRGIEGDG